MNFREKCVSADEFLKGDGKKIITFINIFDMNTYFGTFHV